MSGKNLSPTGPYHPGPGTAHEVGVMIGFMAAFVIVTVAYSVIWKIGNRKEEAKEMQRRQVLAEKTRPRDSKTAQDDDSREGISAVSGY